MIFFMTRMNQNKINILKSKIIKCKKKRLILKVLFFFILYKFIFKAAQIEKKCKLRASNKIQLTTINECDLDDDGET